MKRFTETGKWANKWFRSLSPEHKLFWIFLCENCDNSGVWQGDFDLASFQVGFKVTAIPDPFKGRVKALEGGKFFISSFIYFQWGELSETSHMYKHLIALINKHGLIEHLPGKAVEGAFQEVDKAFEAPKIGLGMDTDTDRKRKREEDLPF